MRTPAPLITALALGALVTPALSAQSATDLADVCKTLGNAKVVSLCHSGDWTTLTAPRLAKVVGTAWFDALDARMTDIVNADYRAILGDH